jgi:hypothetical protein
MAVRAALPLFLALGIAACTDLQWQNAKVPESMWATDRQQCNAAAYAEARQLYEDPFLSRDLHRAGVEGDLARMRHAQQQDRERMHAQSAFDRCMKERGYERVARDPAAGR